MHSTNDDLKTVLCKNAFNRKSLAKDDLAQYTVERCLWMAWRSFGAATSGTIGISAVPQRDHNGALFPDMTWGVKKGSWSFCVCTQPMRDGVTVYCHLSLAGRIHKMISENDYELTNVIDFKWCVWNSSQNILHLHWQITFSTRLKLPQPLELWDLRSDFPNL